ncbi:hypothetical protein [Lysinibacillus xylanilyticus]|uniref:Lipoprotein n=1 Tax=Lysinibacillus xylanilyticus TaxID=582475 RepID=A0ABT4EWR9_9BACI|nr:hypothetical protein [Lysinibacillus xylanilyticus]MCY9550070.1 hypothetical protein [Lysinibacillus xylanilyticus]
MYTQKIMLALFLFIVLLTGCGLETKTLTEFYKNDLEDVTKIQVQDGGTGYSKITTDKKVIDEFLSEIKDVQFIPEENQEDRAGFLYSITLYEDEQMTFIFTENEVTDYYYYTEPGIYPIVDSFYKNLKVEEE